MLEVALLMGLMCKFSCEECEFVTFQEASWHPAQVERGTILDTLQRLLEQQNEIRDKVCVKTNSFLEDFALRITVLILTFYRFVQSFPITFRRHSSQIISKMIEETNDIQCIDDSFILSRY